MEVVLKKSICDIDDELWDSIVPDNSITKTHAFLEGVEKSMSKMHKFWYYLFFEKNQLVGHACVFTHYVKMEDVVCNEKFEKLVRRTRKYKEKLFKIVSVH